MIKQRNTGVDLLRILAAYMVIVLHILGQGGLLAALPSHSLRYQAAWCLEVLCYCAVNCFGLISGFVGWNSRGSLGGILRTWLQVVFFTVGAAVVLHFFIPEAVTLESIHQAFFPVQNKKYWYYTAYFCMSFFVPAMNHLIQTFPKIQLQRLVIAGTVLLSLIPTGLNRDLFHTEDGYTVIWLMYLYTVGGYFGKYPVSGAVSRKCGWVYLLCVGLTGLHKLYPGVFGPLKALSLLEYTSPTILLSALSLLIFLAQWEAPKGIRGVIHRIAPLSFGTYLLHAQGTVYSNFMKQKFGPLGQEHTVVMLLTVLSTAAFWFLLGIAVDALRQKLFLLLRIPALCKKLDRLPEKTPPEVK